MQSKINHVSLDDFSVGQQNSGQGGITTQGPVEDYLAWKQTHSRTAFKAYRIWVQRFQAFVCKIPEEIKLSDVTAFMQMIQQSFSPKNVEYAMNIVVNYLRFWKEQGRLFLPLYLVRVPTAIANSHNAITEAEYSQMLQALPSNGVIDVRNQCILRLLHDTGMRVGELCALDIGDIEEETSVIKTEKTTQRRRVFWTDETDQVLKEYLKLRKEIKSEISTPNALFLGFSPSHIGRITSRSVQRIVKYVMQMAKLVRIISPHSFRHGFIHRLANKGVPDAIIAYLVGHSTPFTIAHYTKLSRPEIRDAFQLSFEETIMRGKGMGMKVPMGLTV